jgi:hypothetical protein
MTCFTREHEVLERFFLSNVPHPKKKDYMGLSPSAQHSTEVTGSYTLHFTVDELTLFEKFRGIIQFFLELSQLSVGDLHADTCPCMVKDRSA